MVTDYARVNRGGRPAARIAGRPITFLEVEHRLQLNFARCRRRPVGAARDRVWLSEDRGTQVSDQGSVIDIVKYVTCVHAKREAVTASRCTAQSDRPAHRSTESTTARATAAAAASSTGRTVGSAHARCRFLAFWSKTDSLTYAQVQCKSSRAGPVIRRNRGLP